MGKRLNSRICPCIQPLLLYPFTSTLGALSINICRSVKLSEIKLGPDSIFYVGGMENGSEK